MASYDISEIEDALVVILSGLPALKTVLDYDPKRIPALPAATLFYSGFEQGQTESQSFTITHKWILRLYVKLVDAKRAQDLIKELIEDVLVAFKANQKFGGSVNIRGVIPSGDVGVILDRERPLMVAELDVTGMKQED